jgi:hypothetical protein
MAHCKDALESLDKTEFRQRRMTIDQIADITLLNHRQTTHSETLGVRERWRRTVRNVIATRKAEVQAAVYLDELPYVNPSSVSRLVESSADTDAKKAQQPSRWSLSTRSPNTGIASPSKPALPALKTESSVDKQDRVLSYKSPYSQLNSANKRGSRTPSPVLNVEA